MRVLIISMLLVGAACSGAELERVFDFSEAPENGVPAGFKSLLSGAGRPAEWKIVWDTVPPLLQPLSANAPAVARKPVLAQVSTDPTDERFPILVYEPETYGDFRFSARVKAVSGTAEQMAGIVFRVQNETNYYVLRASALGNTFRFYKVVDGQRGLMPGLTIPIESNTWHEVAVECKGTQIKCFLNGKQVIPTITDTSFSAGKIGFWTKSDSVSYFSDARITYTPREIPAQAVVRDVAKRNSRLIGLRLYGPGTEPDSTRVIASKDEKEIGQPGGKPELHVLRDGPTYYGKEKGAALVTMPLRDRNGDIVAAAKVIMKSFPGQTERNAVERAAPIVRELQQALQANVP